MALTLTTEILKSKICKQILSDFNKPRLSHSTYSSKKDKEVSRRDKISVKTRTAIRSFPGRGQLVWKKQAYNKSSIAEVNNFVPSLRTFTVLRVVCSFSTTWNFEISYAKDFLQCFQSLAGFLFLPGVYQITKPCNKIAVVGMDEFFICATELVTEIMEKLNCRTFGQLFCSITDSDRKWKQHFFYKNGCTEELSDSLTEWELKIYSTWEGGFCKFWGLSDLPKFRLWHK